MGDAVSGPVGLSDPDAFAVETAGDARSQGGGADRISHRLSGELECIWNVDSARGQQGCVLPATVCTRVRRAAGALLCISLRSPSWRRGTWGAWGVRGLVADTLPADHLP